MLEVEIRLYGISLSNSLRRVAETYGTSLVSHGPNELLSFNHLWLSQDQGNELNFGVFGCGSRVVDSTVFVLWEELGVDLSHLSVWNEMECLTDCEDGDCQDR